MGTTGQSVTLANSIIGVGILAMPFCFQQCGVLLATLILMLMGFVSRLCCHFLLKSAILTRRRTFEFLAFHVFGPAGKLAIEVGIIGFLMGTCIAYFVVVGDLGPQIIAKLLNINQSDILRTSIMVIVSLVCVLPLGLLRNVDSLSNVSAATICFYFCLVIKVILEATSQLLTSDWNVRIEMWKPAGVLQCVPIFSMALFCQTQLFEIFEPLQTLSLEKMNVVTKNAINICTAVYFTLGFFGYVSFGSRDISGNILMSLSPTMASDVIKLGFVMSLAFSFPLIIFPCRASLYSFLYKKAHSSHHDHIINHSIPETTFRCITVAIVAVALVISLLLPNIELVLGLLGSTIGVLVCVVFPAACFVNVTFKNTNERILAKVVVILGLIILVLGTYANLQAAESKYDDKYITQERIDKMVDDFFDKLEKRDDIAPKPQENSPMPISLENKNAKETILDSEVQPPNPIPPESHSNEKNPQSDIIQKETELKELLPQSDGTKEKANVMPETHPRDLKTKLDEVKLANGNSKAEAINNEKNKEEVKTPPSNQEKLNMLEQQRLIETIKQHGEEQKELIKEQKEILHEILKTKQELEKDKKEVDNTEAKKIAVESIQKIANMAIQSLSGVTEKSVAQVVPVEKNAEPLQKIANEAVQEIAKKAAETLEAIGEIKETKEKIPKPLVKDYNKNVQDIKASLDSLNDPSNIKVLPKISDNVSSLVQSNNGQPQAPVPNENIVKPQENIVLPILKQEPVKSDSKKFPQHNKHEKTLENVNKIQYDVKENILKDHLHSPVEPQSYKGEDTKKENVNPSNSGIAQNVPLPLALNSQTNNAIPPRNNDTVGIDLKQNKLMDKENFVSKINAVNAIGTIKDNSVKKTDENVVEPVLIRQKREVVDCTEKTLLKPEDKQICENLIANPGVKSYKNVYPSDVKLNIGLPEKFPIHSNIIHQRSLKSYTEGDLER